jgi:hypothetical protein
MNLILAIHDAVSVKLIFVFIILSHLSYTLNPFMYALRIKDFRVLSGQALRFNRS